LTRAGSRRNSLARFEIGEPDGPVADADRISTLTDKC